MVSNVSIDYLSILYIGLLVKIKHVLNTYLSNMFKLYIIDLPVILMENTRSILMSKQLLFETRQNLKKPPKVYVRDSDTKAIIGSFTFDKLSEFNGWDKLSQSQKYELQRYMQNIQAIMPLMDAEKGYNTEDLRFRLPSHLTQGLYEINALMEEENRSFDIYDSLVKSILQTLLSASNQLSHENKYKLDFILAKIGLIHTLRSDYKYQNKAIFSELCKINNKVEKLYQKALQLFQKDKSYSALSLENMANGEMIPQKWLSACAIAVLLDENVTIIDFLNYDDIFMLFAKPLLDHGCSVEDVFKHTECFNERHLNANIERYKDLKEKLKAEDN